jgi:hypothetical protein
MIEKYLLRAGCDKEFFCVLEYDTEKDKFRAYRINDNGAAVIPFLKKRKEIGDDLCRFFIKNHVMPDTRENVEQVLINIGMKRYDPWELFKYSFLRKSDGSEDYCDEFPYWIIMHRYHD